MSDDTKATEQALLAAVDAEAALRDAAEATQDGEQAPAMVEVPVRDEGMVYMSAEAAFGWDDRNWR